MADDALLTTAGVAALLRVHPKHVYRLLRRGLPAQRVGGEWRYSQADVLRWAGASTSPLREAPPALKESADAGPPSFLAANGDVAIELLLDEVQGGAAPLLGFVQADAETALGHLRRGEVLAAGCHGMEPPARLDAERLVRIHLVEREIGIATPHGKPLRSLAQLAKLKLGARPSTAGVRRHLDAALRAEGLEPADVLASAPLLASHRDVACAVARREVDAGLVSSAWAARVGLAFRPLAVEPYGLVVRAGLLGDPRVVRLCEAAQAARYRTRLRAVAGYEPRDAGAIRYDSLDSGR